MQKSAATHRQHLVTIGQAADYLDCTDRTIRRYIADGRLPAYRIGPRSVRLRANDLDALLQRIPTGGDDA